MHSSLLSNAPPPPLEITDWHWGPHTDSYDEFVVKVQNNTARAREHVKVRFESYDVNGSLLASDFCYVTGLAPGRSSSTTCYATRYGTEKKAKVWLER